MHACLLLQVCNNYYANTGGLLVLASSEVPLIKIQGILACKFGPNVTIYICDVMQLIYNLSYTGYRTNSITWPLLKAFTCIKNLELEHLFLSKVCQSSIFIQQFE